MAFNLLLNGNQYTDAEFTDDELYAQSFEKAIGDFYEHMPRQWILQVSEWTSDTVFKVLNWNQFTAWPTIAVGSFVIVFSKSKHATYRRLCKVTALSINSTELTVTVGTSLCVIGADPSAAPVSDWICMPCGITNQITSTLTLAEGGTGATTAEAASQNLGLISPAVYATVVADDFCGYAVDTSEFNSATSKGHWFKRGAAGVVNFCAHADTSIMQRFPNTRLRNHPGLIHNYVVAVGDESRIDMRIPQDSHTDNGIIFSATESALEWMFKLNGPTAENGGFELRMGLSDYQDGGANEMGIGINPFGEYPSDVLVPRLYAVQSGVFNAASVGPIATETLLKDYWYKFVLTKNGTGNLKGALYGMTEEGETWLVATLGEVTHANTPSSVALVPFLSLTKFDSSSAAYIETLADYCRLSLKISR